MNLVTPVGFRDVLGVEAVERERIERSVQDLFASHGFAPIETPTLEVMDVLRAGGRVPSSPFKLFDSRGDLLAMRPDVTLQVARMCATRMPADLKEARLRYTQRVFRDSEGAADASPREITQIGVECIGESGASIDQELIQLMISALKCAGVVDICIAVATVAPLRALLARSGAPDEWKRAVLQAFHKSDFVELDRLTDVSSFDDMRLAGIAPAYASAINTLPRIRGGKDSLAAVRALVEPLGCADGLAELEGIYSALSENRDVSVLVDFSVMSSFDYYTGVIFEAYSPESGTPLGSGGRYDGLLAAYGKDLPAAGFAFTLEQAMAVCAAGASEGSGDVAYADSAFVEGGLAEACAAAPKLASASEPALAPSRKRKLRIAVPKGALHSQAVECLREAGLDVEGLRDIGRQLVISAPDVEYIIVRPSDAPAFVAYGAADCGICGRDSLLESQAQVVQLVDLGFGGCRFVVAEPKGAGPAIEDRYRRLGSIRVATKYPNITLDHYAKTGIQVDIVKLHGNIELAPLTGMAERIVDITATGTTLRENDLEIVEDVLSSTARFFANTCALRTNPEVVELADKLAQITEGRDFDPIAGKAM